MSKKEKEKICISRLSDEEVKEIILTLGGPDYISLPMVYYSELSPFKDDELGRLIRALLRFGRTGEKTVFEGPEKYISDRLYNQHVLSIISYYERSEKASKAALAGAKARKEKADAAVTEKAVTE